MISKFFLILNKINCYMLSYYNIFLMYKINIRYFNFSNYTELMRTDDALSDDLVLLSYYYSITKVNLRFNISLLNFLLFSNVSKF